MSKHLARTIADSLHHKGAYLAPSYADPTGASALLGTDRFAAVGSSLFADLQDVASATPDAMAATYDVRKVEIAASYGFRAPQTEKPFVFQDGIAVIPVHGLLVNRFSSSWGFITGYNFIRAQMNAALEDGDVELLAYDVNSFGGAAAGCPELSEDMFKARSVKRSVAVIDAFCYSAGYFLASAANKVICTPSGGVGSIGTVAMHMSVARALKDMGIDITYIYAGDHKVDGNPYEKLSAGAKAEIQKSVDDAYGMFVDGVARNRRMAPSAVRATQARCYSAIDAKAANLIDAVEVPSRAVAMFLGELANDDPDGDEDDTEMSTSQQSAPPAPAGNQGTQQAPAGGTAPQAAAPAAPAAPTAPTAPANEGSSNGPDLDARVQAAVRADRARCAGINALEESKGREQLASHLANLGMSVDEAKGILAASPKVEPQANAGGSPFHQQMDRSQHPNVGGGSTEGAPDTQQNGGRDRTRVSSAAGAVFGVRKTPAAPLN